MHANWIEHKTTNAAGQSAPSSACGKHTWHPCFVPSGSPPKTLNRSEEDNGYRCKAILPSSAKGKGGKKEEGDHLSWQWDTGLRMGQGEANEAARPQPSDS